MYNCFDMIHASIIFPSTAEAMKDDSCSGACESACISELYEVEIGTMRHTVQCISGVKATVHIPLWSKLKH